MITDAPPLARPETPLCVDLDGTLVRTDLLEESFLRVVRSNPLRIFRILFWLLRGRAHLKYRLAEIADVESKQLPYNLEVLEFTRQQSSANRPVYLVTAAAPQMADLIAKDQGCFGGVISSSKTENLKGAAKARHLTELFGPKGFDYIGDSSADIPVFEQARVAYFATADRVRADRYRKKYNVEVIPLEPQSGLRVIVKAIRVHQWAKNFLIFVPLILSHLYREPGLWISTGLGFLSFGLSASGVYLLNDLVDIEADRAHETKRKRPIASGYLRIRSAMALSMIFFVGSFSIATLLLPVEFLKVLSLYFVATTLYSFWLKELLILDAVCLALLYTVRIVAGIGVTGAPVSHWLLAFSMFIFLSLAFVKRSSELSKLKTRNYRLVKGRAYTTDDLPIIQTLGVASGLLSVLVGVLYLDSEVAKQLYKQTSYLMMIIPILLYWIGRVWTLAARGQIAEDPVVWAIKDRVSHVVLVVIGLLFFMAI